MEHETKMTITNSQQKELFVDFHYRMEANGIKENNHIFSECMMDNSYLNVLRAACRYALTCYKAQGGEWNYLYLDIPRWLSKDIKPRAYQWLYISMTRAKKTVYVVDDFFIE